MATSEHSDIHLFPKKDALIRRVIEDSNIFAPWVGDVEAALVDHADGTRTREVIRGSKGIVERITGYVEEGTDSVLIPLGLNLDGDFAYGNQDYEGTGQELQYKWRLCFINQAAKVVAKKLGQMSDLRVSKLERSVTRATPALKNFFISRKNAEFISAHYDGHSLNVTAGLDNSPDGIGAKRVFHPNMYMNTVDPDAGGTFTTVGTEFYNKTPAEITAKIHTDYADLHLASVLFINKMEEKIDDLHIQKAATYKGKPYWLVSINRNILNTLKENATFLNGIQVAFMGEEYNNPLFGQDVWIWGECMFILDKKLCRAWNNDLLNFAGTNGFAGRPTFTSAKPNGVVNVFGPQSLGYADVVGYKTVLRTYNFEQQSELLGLGIFGVSRGEYVEKTNEAAYFATGQTVRTTLAAAMEVKNQSSAQFIVKTTA